MKNIFSASVGLVGGALALMAAAPAFCGDPLNPIDGNYVILEGTWTIMTIQTPEYGISVGDGEVVEVATGATPALEITNNFSSDAPGGRGISTGTSTIPVRDALIDLRALESLEITGAFDHAVRNSAGTIRLGNDVFIDLASYITTTTHSIAVEVSWDPNAYLEIGDNLTLKAYGTGIDVLHGGKAEVGDNAVISSVKNGGVGIDFIDSGDSGEITIGKGASITSYHNAVNATIDSASPPGTEPLDATASITIGDGAKIASTDRTGAMASDTGAVINLGNDTSVSAYLDALYADYGGAVHIKDNAELSSTAGYAAYALNAGSEITIGSNAILKSFDRGLVASKGGKIGVGEGATVTTTVAQSQSVAVTAQNVGSEITIGANAILESPDMGLVALDGGKIGVDEGVTVTTTAADSTAVHAENAGSEITIGSNATLESSATGLYAYSGGKIGVDEGVTVTTTAAGSTAVMADALNEAGSEITIGKNATLISPSTGLAAYFGGKITVEDGAEITVSDTVSTGVAVRSGGMVELGDAKITTPGGINGLAFYAMEDQGNPFGTAYINANGVYDITGGLIADAGDAQIDLSMQSGSSLLGYSALGNALSVINMDMKGSTWTMTTDSALTSLNIDSASSINFASPQNDAFKTLHTSSLTGNGGLFVMRTDITGQAGDLLVADDANGSHKLHIADRGAESVDGSETLVVVETQTGNGVFALANDVVVGPWVYGLRDIAGQAGGTDWELYSTGKSSPGGSGGGNTFVGSYFLAYEDTQTLMQRLGDLRNTPNLDSLWIRAYGGQIDSGSRSFVRGFDMDYGGVQIGYDRRIENNRNDSWKGNTYVGGYLGYSKGSLDFDGHGSGSDGDGNVYSKSLGLYATYVRDDGIYVDAVLKYMRMKNNFDVVNASGARVKGGDISTDGFGASLEVGKRFRFNNRKPGEPNENQGHWFVEPQLQYSYTHHDGGHFKASDGLRIGVDKFSSSLGRVGFLVGHEKPDSNFYAKLSYVKEFDGDADIIANGVKIPESLGDNWFVYGVGYTSRFNDRNNIYMSLERAEGGDFTQTWKLYAGWRRAF